MWRYLCRIWQGWTAGPLFWLHLVFLIPVLIATAFWRDIFIPTTPSGPIDTIIGGFFGLCCVVVSLALADMCVCCLRNRKGK